MFEHRKDKYMFGAQVCQLTAGFENDSDGIEYYRSTAEDSLFILANYKKIGVSSMDEYYFSEVI